MNTVHMTFLIKIYNLLKSKTDHRRIFKTNTKLQNTYLFIYGSLEPLRIFLPLRHIPGLIVVIVCHHIAGLVAAAWCYDTFRIDC